MRKPANLARDVALFAWLVLPAAALAEEPFLDTRLLFRHGGHQLPAFVPVPGMVDAPPTFDLRRAALPLPAQDWNLDSAAMVKGGAGWVGGGNTFVGAAQGRQGGDWGSGVLALRTERSFAYDDAAGSRVDYGYDRRVAQGRISLAQGGGGNLGLYGFSENFSDFHLPHYSMDANDFARNGLTLSASGKGGAVFDSWSGSFGWSRLSYDLDNFTWRQGGSRRIQVEAQYDSWGGELILARGPAKARTELALNAAFEQAQSRYYQHELSPQTISAYRWPDVDAVKAGAGLHHHREDSGTRLDLAARLDLLHSESQADDSVPSLPAGYAAFAVSQRQLVRTYYGTDDTAMTHATFSAKVRVEEDVGGNTVLFASLARLMRNPDLNERAIAQTGPGAGREVGNPTLDPEAHHKAELGLKAGSGGYAGFGRTGKVGSWQASASASADRVKDFIAIDRAHGQAGILANDNAVIYRNIDAWITAQQADLQAEVADGLGLRANLTAMRGRDITDHRPLYQVPPLELNLLADLHGGEELGWNAGTRLRVVGAKRSVDDSTATGSGFDAGGQAGAFATMDLYAGLRFGAFGSLAVGVENLFDKLYRDHILAMPQTVNTTALNAPGRTFFLRTAWAW